MEEKKELIVDMDDEQFKKTVFRKFARCNKLCYQINNTEPMNENLSLLLEELFENRLDSTSFLTPPLQIDYANVLKSAKTCSLTIILFACRMVTLL